MTVKLVIFDCDGVLVDSEPLANRILAGELSAIGFPHTVDDCDRRYRGLSMAHMLELIEERWGKPLPVGFEHELQAKTFAEFERYLMSVAGIEAVLDWLAERGTMFCVASSGRLEKMQFTLSRTGLLPRLDGRLFSATEVKEGKPAPDLFLHAASRMGVDAAACLVIEDSLPGVEAAVAAHMQVLVYCANLEQLSCDTAERMGATPCDSMAAVLEYLRQALA